MSFKTMDLYQKGSIILKNAGITDWEYDCRQLLEWTCNITRMDLLLEPDKRIEQEQAKQQHDRQQEQVRGRPVRADPAARQPCAARRRAVSGCVHISLPSHDDRTRTIYHHLQYCPCLKHTTFYTACQVFGIIFGIYFLKLYLR